MSTTPIMAITIVGPSTRKPQKMKAWMRPGAEPLQQLALAQHDRRLVLGAPRAVAGALHRRARLQQRHQEADPDGEQAPAHRQRRGEQDGGDGDAYVPRTFLISAEIAGTTSCRSPITA